MSADPLVIDGMRAVELARLTQGLPGWPGLHRYQRRAHPERVERVRVPLEAAEIDVKAGWPLDAYAYPVPRERIEAECREHDLAWPRSVSERRKQTFSMRPLPLVSLAQEWRESIEAALRGSDDAIHTVACALARRDRDELRAN